MYTNDYYKSDVINSILALKLVRQRSSTTSTVMANRLSVNCSYRAFCEPAQISEFIRFSSFFTLDHSELATTKVWTHLSLRHKEIHIHKHLIVM